MTELEALEPILLHIGDVCSFLRRCAVIELEAREPIRLANIMKKAWMEAGIKRGLKGTVTVPEATGKVQILAEGPLNRLQSFAEWCGYCVHEQRQSTICSDI